MPLLLLKYLTEEKRNAAWTFPETQWLFGGNNWKAGGRKKDKKRTPNNNIRGWDKEKHQLRHIWQSDKTGRKTKWMDTNQSKDWVLEIRSDNSMNTGALLIIFGKFHPYMHTHCIATDIYIIHMISLIDTYIHIGWWTSARIRVCAADLLVCLCVRVRAKSNVYFNSPWYDHSLHRSDPSIYPIFLLGTQS